MRIANALGGYSYIQNVTAEVYRLMLERYSIDVKRRQSNLRARAAEEGMSKSNRDKISCVDAIAQDKKAIEAYLNLIKELAIKHGVDKSA